MTLELLSFKVAEKVFGRFPSLCLRVQNLSQQLFAEEKEKTKEILDKYVESETLYIFTNDSKYMIEKEERQQEENQAYLERAAQVTQTTVNAVSSTIDNFRGRKTRYSSSFIQEFRRRLNVYFSIVLRNIRDSVPKIIGHFLVRKTQKNMHYKIYTQLSQQEDLDLLFGEPDHVAHERLKLKEQSLVLSKALNIINKDFVRGGEFDQQLEHDIITSNITYKNKNINQTTSISTTTSIQSTTGIQSMTTGQTTHGIYGKKESIIGTYNNIGQNNTTKTTRSNVAGVGPSYVNGFSNLSLNSKKPSELMKKVVSNNPLFD